MPKRRPVLLLGRPRLFPKQLLSAIDDELCDAGRAEGVIGRFDFPCNDPFAKQDEYRRVHDAYSGLCFPSLVFSESNGLTTDLLREYKDYTILRTAQGRYRSFVFAYGSGSLGTLAAAQTLIDTELNQMILSIGTVEYLRKHQYVELLLQAEQRSTPHRPRKSDFSPSSIRIEVRPVPPVHRNASAFLRWLPTDSKAFSVDAGQNPLYQRRNDRPGSFDCVQIHPNRVGGSSGTASRLGGWAMVGGLKVEDQPQLH